LSKPDADAVLHVRDLHKSFRMGETDIDVLRGVNLEVRRGELLAIEGRSGEGKSTLLHLMGALDQPDAGSIHYDGKDLVRLGERGRAKVRNRAFGFVFQFYHLLPELNVLENTMTAAMVTHGPLQFRRKKAELQQRAEALLEAFGMSHRTSHKPSQLSGGERQRVAIARALMNRPPVLFADEPTGNLDSVTGRQIMEVIEALHRDEQQTVVFVTHDRTLATTADRSLILRGGVLVDGD